MRSTKVYTKHNKAHLYIQPACQGILYLYKKSLSTSGRQGCVMCQGLLATVSGRRLEHALYRDNGRFWNHLQAQACIYSGAWNLQVRPLV